jgi:hypothetical protein
MILASPTLSKLLTNVRNFLNAPNPANSFWTDAELTEYLNEGSRMYFAEVIKNSEGYFETTTTLDYTSGTETVALPTGFFEVKALYIARPNGWEILPYYNNLTSGFLTTNGAGGANTYSPSYSFQGNNLVLHPTPNATSTGGQLRLDYVQFPDQMVNGGDQLTNQVSPVFKQLLEMYAVMKAKTKESMVTGVDLVTIPARDLGAIYSIFKSTINKRSQYPEYIIPFNPEGA